MTSQNAYRDLRDIDKSFIHAEIWRPQQAKFTYRELRDLDKLLYLSRCHYSIEQTGYLDMPLNYRMQTSSRFKIISQQTIYSLDWKVYKVAGRIQDQGPRLIGQRVVTDLQDSAQIF